MTEQEKLDRAIAWCESRIQGGNMPGLSGGIAMKKYIDADALKSHYSWLGDERSIRYSY